MQTWLSPMSTEPAMTRMKRWLILNKSSISLKPVYRQLVSVTMAQLTETCFSGPSYFEQTFHFFSNTMFCRQSVSGYALVFQTYTSSKPTVYHSGIIVFFFNARRLNHSKVAKVNMSFTECSKHFITHFSDSVKPFYCKNRHKIWLPCSADQSKK